LITICEGLQKTKVTDFAVYSFVKENVIRLDISVSNLVVVKKMNSLYDLKE